MSNQSYEILAAFVCTVFVAAMPCENLLIMDGMEIQICQGKSNWMARHPKVAVYNLKS
jgi:hypothetical protein